MRRRDLRIGDLIWHASGEFLGEVIEIGKVIVKFTGPRVAAGNTYAIATLHEVTNRKPGGAR